MDSKSQRNRALRFLVSTFLTAALPQMAWASVSLGSRQNSCAAIFSQSLAPAQLNLKAVLSLTQREFEFISGFNAAGVTYPLSEREAIIDRAIRAVVSLPSEQKAELLSELLEASPALHPIADSNLRLALGDKLAWRKLLNEIVQEGYSHDLQFFGVTEYWARRVSEMPQAERKEIVRLIGTVYSEARSTSDGHGSPKRELDYLVHAGLQGGEIILNEIRRGQSPESAYDVYLKSQNEWLRLPSPGRGNYSAQLVFSVLNEIKKAMSAHGIPRLLVGGSFTAGRADVMKSDVDYMTDEWSLGRDLEMTLSDSINKRLRQLGFDTRLHVSHFPGEIGSPKDRSYKDDLASSNPVLFVVEQDRVAMYVYPTRLWLRGESYESAMTEPRIFTLSQ